MQILKKLYQVGGSLNGQTWDGGYKSYNDCNTYLVKGEGGCVLFDCGNGETWGQVAENMAYWGFSPGDIKACFLTHAHMDHAGAGHILNALGIPVYAHRQTALAAESGDERCAGYLYHKQFTPCKIDHAFTEDTAFCICGIEIQTMHCPGHTAGCTAYRFAHEDRRVTVSGDIIGTLLDGYFGWDGSFDFDRGAYLESLRRFARVESDLMLSGHGLVYFGRAQERVEEALCVALCEWR